MKPLSERDARWVEETLKGLSLRKRIGQLLVPFVPGSTKPDEIERMVTEHGLGGLRLSGVGLADQREKIKRGQAAAEVPLLMPGNLESGAGAIVPDACTSFTTQMGLGATDDVKLAERMGEAIAVEGGAVGYNMYLGPVVDLCATHLCPKNVRSLGRDPQRAGRLAAAIIRNVQKRGMVACAKHFPGNGFSDLDTHLTTHINPLSKSRWLRESGAIFRKTIRAGVYSVMSSHIALPSWDPEPGDPVFPRPASLSRPIMVDLLRGELGFDGLVTVDAINMGGMSMHLPYFEMVIECIRAGNDLLLFVRRLGEVVDYLEKAVREKRLDEARIEDGARRVLTAKARIGLHRRPRVNTDEECAKALKDTPYRVDAKAMAERSLTLVRDRRDLVPLRLPAKPRIASVLVTNHANFKLTAFDGALVEAGGQVTSIRAPMDVGALYDQVESGAFDAIVVSLYYPPSFAWNTERCHGPESRGLMNGWMIANPKVPCVYISFSNPHHVYEFPYMDPYLCTWGGDALMQTTAARALLGKLPIVGRMPIALPGFFKIGDGIQRSVTAG